MCDGVMGGGGKLTSGVVSVGGGHSRGGDIIDLRGRGRASRLGGGRQGQGWQRATLH